MTLAVTIVGIICITVPLLPILFVIPAFDEPLYIKTKCQIIEYRIESRDCYYCNIEKCDLYYICYSGGILLNYTWHNNNISNTYIIYNPHDDGLVRYHKIFDNPDLILEKLEKKYKINDIITCYYPNSNTDNDKDIIHINFPRTLVGCIMIITACGLVILVGLCLIISGVITECKNINSQTNHPNVTTNSST